jgi:hypothetical protein
MAADRLTKEPREVLADRKRCASLANVLIDRVLDLRQRSVGLADVKDLYAVLARDLAELATALRRGTTPGDFEEQLVRRDSST